MNRRLVKFVMMCTLVSMIFGGFVTTLPKTLALEPTFNLKVTPFCGYNMLEWETVKGAENYWIYRGPGEGEEYSTPLTDFPISDNNFKDEINIENNKKYCYYVRAVDTQAEEFAQSIEACATPTCPEEEEIVECRLVLKYQVGNKMYWVADKQKGPMEAPPEINLNRMFLLIRYAAEEVGAVVAYDAATKTVTITTADGNVLQYQIGNPIASLNGVKKPIDPNNPKVVPYIKNGRSFGPMRWVAENLGATGPDDIKWFEKEKIVELWFDETRCRKTFCFTVERVDCNAKQPLVYGKDADGKSVILYVDKDLCAKMKPGTCWLVTVYPRKPQTNTVPMSTTAVAIRIWKVGAAKQVDCPCGSEVQETCFCATVLRVDCVGDKVLVKDEKGVQWFLSGISKDMCAKLKPEMCIKVCGTPINQQAANLPQLSVKTIEIVNCPCGGNDEECFCVEIVRSDMNSDPPVIIGKDKNGKQFNLSFSANMTRSQYIRFKVGTCWKICGVYAEVISPVTSPFKFKVTKYEEVPCPCAETVETCFCLTIEKVDCTSDPPRIWGKDENGKAWVLILTRELCAKYANYLTVGKCIKVCGIVQSSSPTLAAMPPTIKVTKIEPTDCPCKSVTPDCDWHRGTVISIGPVTGAQGFQVVIEDCNTKQRFIAIAKENLKDKDFGIPLNSYKEKCIEICVKDGVIVAWRALLGVTDCCSIQEEKCWCITITRVDCSSDPPKIWGIDENGQDWVMLLNKELCARYSNYLVANRCIKVCGIVTKIPISPNVDGIGIRVTSIAPMDCPCKPSETCFCFTVEKVDCTSDPPRAWGKDENGKAWVLQLNKAFCDKHKDILIPGKCIKVCGQVKTPVATTNVPTPLLVVTSIAPADCPCKIQEETCICFQIKEASCTGDNLFISGFDENGTAWTLPLNKEICDKWGKYLIAGKCIKVCFIPIPGAVPKITNIYPADCPCKPTTDDCKWIKGRIDSVTRITDTKLGVKFVPCSDPNNVMQFIAENMVDVSGKYKFLDYKGCAEICVGPNNTIVKWKALPDVKDCCPTEEKSCFCFTLEKFEEIDVGVYIIGKSENGAPTKLLLYKEVWAKYKNILVIGKCYIICLDPEGKGNYTITPANCPCKPVTEDCKWVKGRIVGVKVEVSGNDMIVFVTFTSCDGQKELKLKTFSDLIDESGKYHIARYMGCSELCILGDKIIKWKALPDTKDCCGTLECKWVKGEIKFVVIYQKGSSLEIYITFMSCDGQKKMDLKVFEDLIDESGKYHIARYIGCAELCILGDKIVKWKALPDLKDCCPAEVQNCFCFTLEKFEEYGDGVYIVGTSETGAPTRLFLKKEIWAKFKSILVIGKCYKICLDPTGAGNYTITPTDCPCNPGQECNWIRGKITGLKWLSDLNLAVSFTDCKDPTDVKTYISEDLIDITKRFPLSQYRGCAELCVDEKGNIIKWKALPDVKDCCKTEEKETCICLTIDKVNCSDTSNPTITGKDENGIPWTIIMTRELCAKYANYLVVGHCIKVCGIVKQTATTAIKSLQVTSITPTECPCKPQEEACDWIRAQVMITYGESWVRETHDAAFLTWVWQCVDYSGAGGRFFLLKSDLLDTTGKYKFSEYKGCAELCVQGEYLIKWKAITDVNECCPPPTRVGRCTNVEEINCNANPPWFSGATTWPGEKCIVYVTKEQCAELKIGQCFWVHGLIKTPPAGYHVAIEAESLQAANPCPCPQPVVYDMCLKVERTDCVPPYYYVWAKDADGILYMIFTNQAICAQMKPGTCWKVKGWKSPYMGLIAVSLISYESTDCTCAEPKPVKEECFCVENLKFDCKATPPKIYGTTKDGKNVTLIVDKDMCARYAEALDPKACIEVCAVRSKLISRVPTWKVTKITRIDCPCKESKPTCFCVNILRQNCDKNIILAQLGSNLIQLSVPADVCKLMEPGTCWYVCGYYEPIPGSLPGFIVEKFEKRDCPCKDENSDCCNNFRFKMDWPDLNVPLCPGDSTKIEISFTNTCKTDLTLMPVVDNTVAGSTMYASPTTLLIGPGETKSVMVYITLPTNGTSFRGHWKLLIYCGNNNVKTFEFPIKVRDCSDDSNCPKMFKRTELAEIRCKESYVIVGSGELKERLFFTDAQAKEWCNLEVGACYNFCFREDKNGKKWGITATKVECPGSNPTEVGANAKHTVVVIIEDLDTNISVATATTPDDLDININYEDDTFDKLVPGDWYLVTGDANYDYGKKKFTIDADVIEPLKKICVKIDKVNCRDEKYQVTCHQGDKIAKYWTCKIDPELCDSFKPGMCWDLWGIDTGTEGLYSHMNVIIANPTRCPCGSEPLEWADVMVESLDCSSRTPTARAIDPKGKMMILKFKTPEDCKFLKPGDGVRVYGKIEISKELGYVEVEFVKNLKMVCGEVKTIYKYLTYGYATIKVENCAIDAYLFMIDYLGTGINFPFFDNLKVGECYQFFYVDPGYETYCYGWTYYTRFVYKTDCPCGKKRVELKYNCDWKAGKIRNVVQTDFGSWMVEFEPCDRSITYTIYVDPELADVTKKYSIKDFKGCAALCLNDGIVKQWKILPEGECCQEDIQCICVTIEKIDCSGEIGKIYGKDANGKSWVLLLSQTLDFNCKDLEPEMCIEVCGAKVTGTDNAFEIFEIKQVKCPCANP